MHSISSVLKGLNDEIPHRSVKAHWLWWLDKHTSMVTNSRFAHKFLSRSSKNITLTVRVSITIANISQFGLWFQMIEFSLHNFFSAKYFFILGFRVGSVCFTSHWHQNDMISALNTRVCWMSHKVFVPKLKFWGFRNFLLNASQARINLRHFPTIYFTELLRWESLNWVLMWCCFEDSFWSDLSLWGYSDLNEILARKLKNLRTWF